MHEIETFEGHAAFVTARDHAWHRLGTVLDSAFDAQTALTVAHLANWNVRKAPLTATVAIGGRDLEVPVPGKFAIVRDNPFKPGTVDALGVVGNHYAPVQNEEHVELLNLLVDESGAHFETAGSLKGGREVFVSMKMPSTIKVGGVDPVDLYLIARNSHDGSRSFEFLVSPVRVVCANTLAAATRSAKASFRARHVQGGARAAIQQAREALDLTFAYAEEFEAAVARMVEQEYTDQQFSRLTASLFPTPKTAKEVAQENARIHRTNLSRLFRESPTMTEIRGTRWAAYNAVTEYVDHVAEVRGKVGDAAREARALNVATGINQKLKERAFELLSA
jgi:phage/plasmid-like protein (TIGR03299 family)